MGDYEELSPASFPTFWVTLHFDKIENLGRSCKNSTRNSLIPLCLLITFAFFFSPLPLCPVCIQFSEQLENKLETCHKIEVCPNVDDIKYHLVGWCLLSFSTVKLLPFSL